MAELNVIGVKQNYLKSKSYEDIKDKVLEIEGK